MKCTAPKSQDGDKGGHDWVLVKKLGHGARLVGLRLLWACPCGEFQWTSYAEWEKRKAGEHLAEVINDGPDLSKFGLLGALDT